MAQINKISIVLCAFVFTRLIFSPLSYASQQTSSCRVQKIYLEKTIKHDKEISNQNKKITYFNQNLKKNQLFPLKENYTLSKNSHFFCKKVLRKKSTIFEKVHKLRLQQAQRIAITKLMNQIGKPYRWGGTSPHTGFDCSGLVYYAYKDLLKFQIPRTANGMYHLRNAAPINRGELKSGDLVFFQIHNRGITDHVGVYVGNDKFIQSPRSGRNIQITSLNGSYWQRHYVGARRVMTLKTIR